MSSDMIITASHLKGTISINDLGKAAQAKRVNDVEQGAVTNAYDVRSDTVSLSSPEFLEKITQIQGFLEQISYGQTVISTAQDNVETLISKLEELGGVAVRARGVLDSSVSQDILKPQLDVLRQRAQVLGQDVDNISLNTGFEGENLLAGDDVAFVIDPSDPSKLRVEGIDASTEQFGLSTIAFKTSEDAEYIKNLVSQAVDQVSMFKSQLRGSSRELETRKEFSESTIEVFLAQAQSEQTSSQEESDALRSLQSRLLQQAEEVGEDGGYEYLALEAQFELLEHFR